MWELVSLQRCGLASEERAQVSIEYLIIIGAAITLVVLISLFIKNSFLRRWLGLGGEKVNETLNKTG